MQARFGKAVELAETKQDAGLLGVNFVKAAGHSENQQQSQGDGDNLASAAFFQAVGQFGDLAVDGFGVTSPLMVLHCASLAKIGLSRCR